MRTLQIMVWAFVLVLLPFASIAQRGSGGWCSNNNYSRQFNPSAIETLKGSVISVDKITPETGMSTGFHLMVKSEKGENISIHLGPSWYIDNQDIQFVAGDAIEVKGSKITYQNAPAIIAMTVQKGEQLLNLRDKNGNPSWNGLRQGKGGGKNRAKN
jgi:hypothetical protein